MSAATLVLVHSPLTGPRVWGPVADLLIRRGHRALVPPAPPRRGANPTWSDFVEAVVHALARERAVVLVGHSGAGPLLPVIAASASPEVTCHVFVDAALPSRDGPTPMIPPAFLPALEGLAKDGWLPRWAEWWPEASMRALVPDDGLRRELTEEMPSLPIAFFEEPVPVPAGWPDAPCAYLQFSVAYDSAAEDARSRGWRVVRLPGEHLHMVVDPHATADALIELVSALG